MDKNGKIKNYFRLVDNVILYATFSFSSKIQRELYEYHPVVFKLYPNEQYTVAMEGSDLQQM